MFFYCPPPPPLKIIKNHVKFNNVRFGQYFNFVLNTLACVSVVKKIRVIS